MKTIKLLILLFIILPQFIWCQSSEVLNMKKEINDFAVFDYYEKGATLAAKVSELEIEEILELLEKGNSLEKIYGFWAIAKFHKYDYKNLIAGLIADTSKVKLNQIGCLVSPLKSTGKIIFDLSENPQNRFGEYSIHSDFLDSIALTNHCRKDLANIWNQRLFKVQRSEDNYFKIRQKVIERVPQAYGVLAKYQNENDVTLFRTLLNEHSKSMSISSILSCIKYFPHQDFEKNILNTFDIQLNQKYPYSLITTCELLLDYNSNEIKNSFDTIIFNPDKYYYHLVCLWLAVERTNDLNHPIINSILKQVSKKEIDKRIKEFSGIEYYGKARIEREKNKN